MDKHTPLPWYCHAEGSVRICDGAHESVYGCETIAEAEIFGKGRPLAYANAAFIVRAVNSHDALVAIAEKQATFPCLGTNEYNDTCGVTYTCPNCQLAKEAQAALKLAKGE